MARDQEPITEEEFETFEAALEQQREELLEALAGDLGGEPDDYRVTDRPIADGSE